MKTFVYALCLLCIVSCKSVETYNKQVTEQHGVADLKADVDAVYGQLKKYHPRLYQYTSKDVLDFKFDSLKQTINKPMTSQDFYKKLAPVIREVKQGHISVVPPQPRFTKKERKALQKKTFGFHELDFEYLDHKLWVVGARKDSTLIGNQVLKIDDEDPKELIEDYKTLFASDGYNTTLFDRQVGVGFARLYYRDKGFLDSIPLTFKNKDSIFTKVLKRVSQKANQPKTDSLHKADSIPAKRLTKLERKAKRKSEKEKRKFNKTRGYVPSREEYSRNLTFATPDSSLAVMKIRTFSNGPYKAFYDESFHLLDSLKTTNLVLDLRDNGGGRISEIEYLYSYLAKDNYKFINKSEVNNRVPFMAFAMSNASPTGLKIVAAVLSPVIVVHNFIKTSKADDKIYYRFKYSKSRTPKDNNYTGNLYVLINGNSFSASSILSTNLQASNRAFFVGEETGGAYNGTVAGIFRYYELPNSLIRVRMGLMQIETPYKTQPDGYGVKPDKEILPSYNDRINNRDPEMEWVKKQIEQSKN